MAFMLWRRKVRGPRFPDRREVNVLFDERWTTGRSLKLLSTKMGGANNCLRVTVTDEELWAAPHFPFSAFASRFDLDHRIDRSRVTGVEHRGKSVVVTFTLPDKQNRSVELRLRRQDEFMSAMATDVVGVKPI
jgi:hypothetical protein